MSVSNLLMVMAFSWCLVKPRWKAPYVISALIWKTRLRSLNGSKSEGKWANLKSVLSGHWQSRFHAEVAARFPDIRRVRKTWRCLNSLLCGTK